jgi:hypothetical protein
MERHFFFAFHLPFGPSPFEGRTQETERSLLHGGKVL